MSGESIQIEVHDREGRIVIKLPSESSWPLTSMSRTSASLEDSTFSPTASNNGNPC